MENKEPRKIGLVHLVYLLIIAVLIMATVITLNFVGEETLDQKIAFAATLISIIIGALAIFIAVYQGLTQSSSIEKVNEATTRVEEASRTLGELTKITEDVREIKNSFETYDFEKAHNTIDEIKNKFNQFDEGNSKVSSQEFTLTKIEYELIFNDNSHVVTDYFILKWHKSGKCLDVPTASKIICSGDQDLVDFYMYTAFLMTKIRSVSKIKGFNIYKSRVENKNVYEIKEVPDYFEELASYQTEFRLDLKDNIDKYFENN
ncbi:MAG: hypothetical protein ACFWTY_01370 [Shouchella clausii]